MATLEEMADKLREMAAAMAMNGFESELYKQVISHLSPLYEKHELRKEVGICAGSFMHDGIPKLIELAEECLRLRKGLLPPYPTYDAPSNSLMYKGIRISMEVLESLFGCGGDWRGPYWVRRELGGSVVELTTKDPGYEARPIDACPHCRSLTVFASRNLRWSVACSACGMTGPTANNKGEAIVLWNGLAHS